MESMIVLLKAGVALVWVSSLVYLLMKWVANRFWPVPSVPPSLAADPPFWSRAAWRIFQFCSFIAVAWVLAYTDGDAVRPDQILFIGLSAASATYFATILASWVLGFFERSTARWRSFSAVLPAVSTSAQVPNLVGVRMRDKLPLH